MAAFMKDNPRFLSIPFAKLPNISTITYENKIKKQNKTKTRQKIKIRERRNKKITTQAFHFCS